MELRKGFKQTEVGLIPNDWEVLPLNECLVSNPEYGIGASAVPYSLNLPTYLRITDISDDGKFLENNITSVSHSLAKNYFLEDGDLVFARTGASTGKTYLYNPKDGQLVFAGFLIRVKPNPLKLNPNYLKYFTQSYNYWCWVTQVSMRSGQPGINGNEYSKLPIPLPPTIEEQNAIAQVLNDTDELISSFEKLIEKKRLIKQGTMQELFKPKEGWQWKKLGELFEITSSKRVFQRDWTDNGVPFYRARELTVLGEQGFVDNELFISNEMYESFQKQYGVPQLGDLLVTGVGTLGKVYLVSDNHRFYFKDGNIIWFKLRGSINADYLRHLYLTRLIAKQIEDAAAGTTVGTYTISDAKKTTIPVPSLSEQAQIATVISDMDSEINELERKSNKYKAIKQGMMQNLLTGKTRLV